MATPLPPPHPLPPVYTSHERAGGRAGRATSSTSKATVSVCCQQWRYLKEKQYLTVDVVDDHTPMIEEGGQGGAARARLLLWRRETKNPIRTCIPPSAPEKNREGGKPLLNSPPAPSPVPLSFLCTANEDTPNPRMQSPLSQRTDW